MQTDSVPSELPGKPLKEIVLGRGAMFLLLFPPQMGTPEGLALICECICSRTFYFCYTFAELQGQNPLLFPVSTKHRTKTMKQGPRRSQKRQRLLPLHPLQAKRDRYIISYSVQVYELFSVISTYLQW